MYHNPTLQREAVRGVKAGRHVTGAYATNAEGKAFPPFYIFNLTTESNDSIHVKIDWLVGLPSIEGRLGCLTRVESDNFLLFAHSTMNCSTLKLSSFHCIPICTRQQGLMRQQTNLTKDQ